MQLSVEHNKRTIAYIKGILNNWNKSGIRNLTEAKNANEKFKNQTKQPESFKNFNNYNQREYDDLQTLYANQV